jgi:hypothetical protein
MDIVHCIVHCTIHVICIRYQSGFRKVSVRPLPPPPSPGIGRKEVLRVIEALPPYHCASVPYTHMNTVHASLLILLLFVAPEQWTRPLTLSYFFCGTPDTHPFLLQPLTRHHPPPPFLQNSLSPLAGAPETLPYERLKSLPSLDTITFSLNG